MCGVDIEVPLRNVQPVPSSGQPAPLSTQVIELNTFTPTEVRSGLMARSTAVGPWLLKPAKISAFVVTKSWRTLVALAVVAPELRRSAPSLRPIITAGKSSPPRPSLAIAIGSPATLFTTTTPTAPAAVALRTFVLNVQFPRLTIVSFPDAELETLAQASSMVSNNEYELFVGNGGNSPTAAPIVVPPVAG